MKCEVMSCFGQILGRKEFEQMFGNISIQRVEEVEKEWMEIRVKLEENSVMEDKEIKFQKKI